MTDGPYLDNAASVPPFDWALDCFTKSARDFPGNQEAAGHAGVRAAAAVKEASRRLSSALAPGYEVLWCGTGTDALAAAVQAHCMANPGTEIVTTEAEHPALKQAIRRIQNRGGKIILYFNGQLIDMESEYYRSGEGRKVCIKRRDGSEHREFYNFSNTGTFLGEFGNKTFVVACPSCRSWIERLKRHIDFAVELGVDSVFFDQLGLASYPCCDPTHGHPVPFTGLMRSKREMLRELYEYAKSRKSDLGFGIECTTDQTLQYTDFVHIFGYPEGTWNSNWRKNGELPQLKSASYLFKAAFPEAVISNRNIRDDSDVEFPVNRMLLLGSRSDVEIYRCRASIAATPHYQAYLAKANALRERHRKILYQGTFCADCYHSLDNPGIQSNSFLLGDELAVLLTQSDRDVRKTRLTVPGFERIELDSVSGDVRLEGERIVLPRNALAVLIYRKKSSGN